MHKYLSDLYINCVATVSASIRPVLAVGCHGGKSVINNHLPDGLDILAVPASKNCWVREKRLLDVQSIKCRDHRPGGVNHAPASYLIAICMTWYVISPAIGFYVKAQQPD